MNLKILDLFQNLTGAKTIKRVGLSIYYWPPVCVRLSSCGHAQAGMHRQAKVGNPFSFVIASDRRECGNLNWSTGKPGNRLTKLIGITLMDRLYFL